MPTNPFRLFRLPEPKPVLNGSWWIYDQEKRHRRRWYAKARRQITRMRASKEAYRVPFRIVDDLSS